MTLLAVMLALAGCRASSEREPVASRVELTSASAAVDMSRVPQTYYDGHRVYLVDRRWMYHDRGRWISYDREPDELARRREYIEQAPPAYLPGPLDAPPPPAVHAE